MLKNPATSKRQVATQGIGDERAALQLARGDLREPGSPRARAPRTPPGLTRIEYLGRRQGGPPGRARRSYSGSAEAADGKRRQIFDCGIDPLLDIVLPDNGVAFDRQKDDLAGCCVLGVREAVACQPRVVRRR